MVFSSTLVQSVASIAPPLPSLVPEDTERFTAVPAIKWTPLSKQIKERDDKDSTQAAPASLPSSYVVAEDDDSDAEQKMAPPDARLARPWSILLATSVGITVVFPRISSGNVGLVAGQ